MFIFTLVYSNIVLMLNMLSGWVHRLSSYHGCHKIILNEREFVTHEKTSIYSYFYSVKLCVFFRVTQVIVNAVSVWVLIGAT